MVFGLAAFVSVVQSASNSLDQRQRLPRTQQASLRISSVPLGNNLARLKEPSRFDSLSRVVPAYRFSSIVAQAYVNQ